MSANAPLEPFLSSERQKPGKQFCLIVDLFSAVGPEPASLENASERSNDLLYGAQTMRRLEGIARERALEARLEPESVGTEAAYLVYPTLSSEAGPEKPFDFSRDTWRGDMNAEKPMERLRSTPCRDCH